MYNIFAIHDFQFSENFLCGLTTAAQHIDGNNIYNHIYRI